MTLIMTLLVRDEADIVRENLAFHLARGVDHVIAMDNGSTDGTTEILEEYARAGALTLLHEQSDAYLQALWVNRMAAMARERFAAEWILNNDADEFWRPPDRPDGAPGDLKAALAGSSSRALVCRRFNMIAAREAIGTGPWSEKLVWRARRPVPPPALRDPLHDPLDRPYFLYDLPNKVMVRADGLVEVTKGCHSAVFDPPASPEHSAIEIYHFPIRSKAKFEASVAHISCAIARDATLPPGASWKYRRWGTMLAIDGNIERAFSETVPSLVETWLWRLRGRMERATCLRDDLRALRAI